MVRTKIVVPYSSQNRPRQPESQNECVRRITVFFLRIVVKMRKFGADQGCSEKTGEGGLRSTVDLKRLEDDDNYLEIRMPKNTRGFGGSF